MLLCSLRAVVAAALLGAAAPQAFAPAAAAGSARVQGVQAEPLRVLVMGSPEWPRIRGVLDMLQRGWPGQPAGRPVVVDHMPFHTLAAFRAALREKAERIPQYAVLYSSSQTLARIAQLEFPQAPLVFDGINDPVRVCLVDSLQRPGRSASGYMHFLPEHGPKALQLLHEAFPHLQRVTVLVSGYNWRNSGCDPDDIALQDAEPDCHPLQTTQADAMQNLVAAQELARAGTGLGLAVRFDVVCSVDDMAASAEAAALDGRTGLLVPWHSLFMDNDRAMAQAIGAHRVPVVYPGTRVVDKGGLMAVEPLGDQGVDADSYQVLRMVLAGRAPATIPVMRPRGFRLSINATAAAALPVRPSVRVLWRADEIVP